MLPGGPAAEDGVLRAGDVLVRVNGELLLGASQSDACRIFVNIPVGDPVAIQVCRGYPLLLDPSNRVCFMSLKDVLKLTLLLSLEGVSAFFTFPDTFTSS